MSNAKQQQDVARRISVALAIPYFHYYKLPNIEALPAATKRAVISISQDEILNDATYKKLDEDGTILFIDQTGKVNTIADQYYDFRVMANLGESIDATTTKALRALKIPQLYVSTREKKPNRPGWPTWPPKLTPNFPQIVVKGLADDRGLFVPTTWNPFLKKDLKRLVKLNYQQRALLVIERFPLGDIKPPIISNLLAAAYEPFPQPAVLPVTPLQREKRHFLMETFHGPTASFKDLSLQFTPRLLNTSLKVLNKNSKLVLLTATSGDTGTAAIEGFAMDPLVNMPVIVLYPKNGVSTVQKLQMTTCTGNVCIIGVDGDFDFCQNVVKDIFNSTQLIQEWRKLLPDLELSSANSINWGRFLPQIVFSISAYCDVVKSKAVKFGDRIDFCVPTGNFGNILGIVWAKKLGLPVHRIFCASNVNNVLTDFIRTGTYDLRRRKFTQTISPAIDILVSSNVERLLWLLSDGDGELVRGLMKELEVNNFFTVPDKIKTQIQALFEADSCTERECEKTIETVFKQTKILIDPHTAVAKCVADKILAARKTKKKYPLLISSTAHWSKFPETMFRALNLKASDKKKTGSGDLESTLNAIMALGPKNGVHPEVAKLTQKPVIHNVTCAADPVQIAEQIAKFIASLNKSTETKPNE